MQDNIEGLRLIKNEKEEYYVDSQGRKQGEYKNFASLGKIFIKCNYVDNKKDGEFIRYYYYTNINKILFKCNYSKGLLHGEYIEYYPSKRKELEGNYVNGEKEGYWYQYEDRENVIPTEKYYEDGVECDPPSIEVKNAYFKV